MSISFHRMVFLMFMIKWLTWLEIKIISNVVRDNLLTTCSPWSDSGVSGISALSYTLAFFQCLLHFFSMQTTMLASGKGNKTEEGVISILKTFYPPRTSRWFFSRPVLCKTQKQSQAARPRGPIALRMVKKHVEKACSAQDNHRTKERNRKEPRSLHLLHNTTRGSVSFSLGPTS